MIIDLLHNKIVADTMTDGFESAVRDKLLALIEEKYGEKLFGIQMYEEYISDNFSLDGEWYYPLTVMTDTGVVTEWVKWAVDKTDFKDGIPYSYIGGTSPVFSLAKDTPTEFVKKLEGRARFAESGLIKIKIESTVGSATFLSGKYSQTFIDEMARQLTPAIESAMSVEGIAGSQLELTLVFAPETYLEHTSENVTYRRLLLTDKSSAPRDFWIKWTRLDGATAYSVSSNVDSSVITFEIGEDVSQKIREKEYRFLVKAGKDKYHNAMGRKNITEWREIIKRAVRRGELTKVERTVDISPEISELEKQLASVLGVTKTEPVAEEPIAEVAEPLTEDEDDFARAMRIAREAVGGDAEYIDEDELSEEEELDEDEVDDELDEYYAEDETANTHEGVIARDDDEAAELDEITKMAKEALRSAEAQMAAASEITFDESEGDEPADEEKETTVVIVPEEPTAEEYEEIEDEEALEDEECNEALMEVRALAPDDDTDEDVASDAPAKTVTVTAAAAPSEPSISREELEEKIRAEVEARIRLEYERDARLKAEAEAERLRREQEQLRLAVEKLQREQERVDAEKARREEERRLEAERLKAQLEMQMRAEAKERERLAEAARIALEEQRRLEEEKLRAERARIEEERRLEEERRRAEEQARVEAERLAEAERIRHETEERARAEASAEDEYDKKNYTYVSKTVKLLFRRSVDPNITARIHEIIKATISYYGKDKVYLRIKATVPDTQTVCLEFVEIPLEEMELLSNIIKILGNSGLGIAKAIVD